MGYSSREVRVLHKPTGLSASCDNEHSQHRNKAKALACLRSKLHAFNNNLAPMYKVEYTYMLDDAYHLEQDLFDYRRKPREYRTEVKGGISRSSWQAVTRMRVFNA